MSAQTQPRFAALFKRLSLASSLTVLLVGCLVLLGWAFDIASFKSVLPGLATMKANTALCFILSGGSLLILEREWSRQPVRYLGFACAVLVAMIGALSLSEYLTGRDLWIDQLLFNDTSAASGVSPPGRMAVATALNFLLSGIALLLFGSRRLFGPMQGLIFATLLSAMLALVGYVYGASSLYRIFPYTSVAVHTAATFAIFCLGVLWARPDRGIMALATSRGVTGIMLRRLLPAAVALPFVLGWLRLAGQRAGYYDTEFGLALFAISNVITFACLLWLTARLVHRIDAGRSAAEEALRQSHDNLETRVRERTAELEASNQRLSFEIAERGRSEEALRQSEERYRQIVDCASDIIYRADTEGRFIYANPVAAKIMKYSETELIGMHYFHLIREDLREEVARFYQAQFIEKAPNTYYEFPIVIGDGTEIWIGQQVQLVIENQRIVGFQAVARDITERKRMEKELEQARDAALDSARIKAEFLANMSHEIRTPMNGVFGLTELLLGTALTPEQQDFVLSLQSCAESLLTIINDILDFSKIEAGKLRFEHIDFDLREAVEGPVEMLAQRAHTRGVEIASLIYQDVPTRLLGDPGRLRQVLTNLVGNAVKFTEKGEVVLSVRREREDETHAFLRFEVRDTGIGISEEAQRRLFNAFSQADSSTTRKFGGTGLGLAISRQLVELMGGEIGIKSAPGKGSTFWFTAHFGKQPAAAPPASELDITLEGWQALIVDDNQTNRHILSYQISSWGMIAAEAETGSRALDLLRACATDGQPFDVAILDLRIPDMDGFELARVIKSDPLIASTHLMLMPSYTQREHGELARQVGFDCYLPKPVRQLQLYNCLITIKAESIASPEEADRMRVDDFAQDTAAHAETIHRQEGLHILLAEDNAVNRKVAIRQLQHLGHTVDAAVNGREALEAIKEKHYDLILMDCQMPEMDGYEATAKIREREGAVSRTPIIAMTAHALEGERDKCLAAGMDDYISKPVKTEILRQVLERWREVEHR